MESNKEFSFGNWLVTWKRIIFGINLCIMFQGEILIEDGRYCWSNLATNNILLSSKGHRLLILPSLSELWSWRNFGPIIFRLLSTLQNRMRMFTEQIKNIRLRSGAVEMRLNWIFILNRMLDKISTKNWLRQRLDYRSVSTLKTAEHFQLWFDRETMLKFCHK